MPFVNVGQENSGGIDLYYEDHGDSDGKPVVLIHGWPLSSRSWEKQVSALLAGGYRVIAYDRRGFGDSSKPAFGYNYDTFAEDLHKLIMKLDLYDAALVGFSMGGGEVARYLGKYGTNRVKKAALVAAVTPFLLKTTDNPDGIDISAFETIKAGVSADRLAFLTDFFVNFYNADIYRGKRISDQAIQFSWNIAAGASPKGTLDCISAFSSTDFRSDLTRISLPTLIVHGDADRIVPIEASGKLTHELVKGSRLVVVKGAPHGLNLTHAEELNHELLGFLSQK